MNLCIVSFQAILLAVLIVQYNNIYEVDAERFPRYRHENWLNSAEKRIEIIQNDADPEAEVVMEKQEIPKRKKKVIKRHKKKIRSKHDKHEHILHEHIPHEKREMQEHELQDLQNHIPHEQRIFASVEQDKVDFLQRDLRNNHKKRGKVQDNKRKFFKIDQRESNSSESDEVKRRKPVDIIVHIKMND